ncbi:3-deoxy-D-manno-octulosonic acid transferase [compost metagenome]
MLSGPHLFNFLEIAEQLREAGALAEVADGEVLALLLQQVLSEPAVRQRMGGAGMGVLQANQGALGRLLEGMERLLQRQ